MIFSTYIVPFDFSDRAMAAAKMAAQLAGLNGGEVVLAHGMQLPKVSSPNPAISAEELIESVRAHVEKRLAESHALLGVKGSCIVRTQPPENWLNDFARSVPAPVVVLGRHGWSGKREGIGSTTKKIVRGSVIPVWVVGTDTGMPERIMAAVETDATGEYCAEAAHTLARRLRGACRFVHVRDPRMETGYLSEIGWPPAVNVFDELRREAESFLQQLAEALDDPKPSAAVLMGSPSQAIVKEAEHWDAQLLITGKHTKGAIERVFLGSTTEAILKHWPRHVLVLTA